MVCSLDTPSVSEINLLDLSQRDYVRERFDDVVNKLHEIFQSFDKKTSTERAAVRKDEPATFQLQIESGASVWKQDDLLINLKVMIRRCEYQSGVFVCNIQIMESA